MAVACEPAGPSLKARIPVMTRLAFAFALALPALGLVALPAGAAEDPVVARQKLMEATGAAAGLGGGMLKGELPYSPAAGLAVLSTFGATAATIGDYFPEGSGGGESAASPKIWEDHASFEDELAEFAEAAVAGLKAAGKNGPADLEAFKAAATPVLARCRDCHESFRIKR